MRILLIFKSSCTFIKFEFEFQLQSNVMLITKFCTIVYVYELIYIISMLNIDDKNIVKLVCQRKIAHKEATQT